MLADPGDLLARSLADQDFAYPGSGHQENPNGMWPYNWRQKD